MFVDQRHDTVRILEDSIQKLDVVLAKALSHLNFFLTAITFGSRCLVNRFTSAIMTPVSSAALLIFPSGGISARTLPVKSSQPARHSSTVSTGVPDSYANLSSGTLHYLPGFYGTHVLLATLR